ncbi:Long-chain acyl-protein thioester reductase [Halioglobus japonicus]|nr:Long-chain acyl-protein thioester reductase [Halioglobus japonicus]
MSDLFEVPLVVRGRVIDDFSETFKGRSGSVGFKTADANKYIDEITLSRPSHMADLYSISLEDIIEYLAELGPRLALDENTHMQQAFELSRSTSGLSDSILRYAYETIPGSFEREQTRRIAENLVGAAYLEGWVTIREGVKVRAFGSRAVHIIAGNVPLVGVATIIRNAITRSDAVIKTPSNDPLTAVAIAQTMIEMAPDHPLSRHVTVAYWKGGDEQFEQQFYQPRNIEKIVAWGGFNSIKHISAYLQPGIDLITLDPKQSSTIIGQEAFDSPQIMARVAEKAAMDVGVFNQEGCVNARVIYLVCGTDEAGLDRARQFATMLFDAIQKLPDSLSTPHKHFDPALKDEVDALRFVEDEYTVIGGRGNEGAVIVSHDSEAVDFARDLACRVANVVPIEHVDTAIRSVNAYTQTIGIYPDALKDAIKDQLAYHGGQRMVSLGGATNPPADAPQDGIEPLRRMCKWIVDDTQ